MRRSALAAVIILVAVLGIGATVWADSVDVLKNGSFEDEFIDGVGKNWGTFNNGGYVSYGYHDDTWSKVLYDGGHSQLLEIHTKGRTGSDRDRYFGIFQTAKVVPSASYMFTLHGMARSTEGTEQDSKWNYRVQVGFDYNGGSDYTAVSEWFEMPWPETGRLTPGGIQAYSRGITTKSDKVTVFIRVWKKFPTVGHEGDINLDGISLVGPDPGAAPAPAALPQTGSGLLVPAAGLGLIAVALGLTGRRLFRR